MLCYLAVKPVKVSRQFTGLWIYLYKYQDNATFWCIAVKPVQILRLWTQIMVYISRGIQPML